MAKLVKKSKALPAAPAKSGKPAPAKKAVAKVEDVPVPPTDNVAGMTLGELRDLIGEEVVLVLASVFGDLHNRIIEHKGSETTEAPEVEDTEEEVEEEKPAKKTRGKKAPEPVAEPEDEEEDEEEASDDDEDADEEDSDDDDSDEDEEESEDSDEDSDYDPDPFPKELLELADEAVKELSMTDEDIKETLEAYLEGAPDDAPATVKIKALFKGKKVAQAWKHLVSLLIDEEGNLHEFDEVYARNGYIYLGGVEGTAVDVDGFTPEKGAALIDLETGEAVKKAPKKLVFETVLHNTVQDTYYGVTADQKVIAVTAE